MSKLAAIPVAVQTVNAINKTPPAHKIMNNMSGIHVDRKLSEYAATKSRATAKFTDTFPVKKATCTLGRVAIIVGIEDKVWAGTAGHVPVYAIADEDPEQKVSEKTSSIRFLALNLLPK